jgi:hypothetical protein
MEEPWETREERERKVALARRVRRKGLREERFVTRAELRELVARQYGQAVISVYLRLTGDTTYRRPPIYISTFNSMRHREVGREELAGRLSRQQRFTLKSDLEELEALLETQDVSGSRSLVVFKSGQELDRVIRLPVPLADSMTIDVDPYVAPLEAVLEEHPVVLVVQVTKEESRFWRQHLGYLEEVASLDSFVPTDTVDASRPGKVQRHRLTHLRWHMKETAGLAARLFVEQGCDLIVLSGVEDVLAELDRFLPNSLRGRLAGKLHPSPGQDRGAWEAQVESVLAEHRRAEEEAAVPQLGDYQGQGLLVDGLPGVLEVVNQFLVRRLFVRIDLAEPGYVCREHHFLSLSKGTCPFDGTELLPAENLVDELIEFAWLHGVELMVFVERPELLDPHAGIAAVTYDLRG